MNFKIDNLQYCNWSREIFEFNREANLDAVHVTIVYHEDYDELLVEIKKWEKIFSSNSDLIFLGKDFKDIEKANIEKKTAIFFGFQNCSPIEDDINLVEKYLKNLDELTSSGYIDNILKKVQPEVDDYLRVLNLDYPQFNLDDEIVFISQTITYKNIRTEKTNELYLYDWSNSYKNTETPLSNRLAEEYNRSFYLSSKNKRGYTKIENIFNNSSSQESSRIL